MHRALGTAVQACAALSAVTPQQAADMLRQLAEQAMAASQAQAPAAGAQQPGLGRLYWRGQFQCHAAGRRREAAAHGQGDARSGVRA